MEGSAALGMFWMCSPCLWVEGQYLQQDRCLGLPCGVVCLWPVCTDSLLSWVGAESRRGLLPLFPFLHECCLLTGLDTTLCFAHALTNNFLPLVVGEAMYFKECWGGLGYFITVLGSLGGGELPFIGGHSLCQASLLSMTGGPWVFSPVPSCLCSLHSKHCVSTMVGAQTVLPWGCSNVAVR